MQRRTNSGQAAAALAARHAEEQGQPLDDQTSIPPELGLDNLAPDTLDDLVRRLRDIDDSLRAAAEKMGQLYMFADLSQGEALTRRLDMPMRSASQNERAFAALLDELQMIARHRAAQLKRLPGGSAAAAPQPSTQAPTGPRARARPTKGPKT